MSEGSAEDLKNKGNEEFKQGRYQAAVEYYSQAICTVIKT